MEARIATPSTAAKRGTTPHFICTDNAPDFIAKAGVDCSAVHSNTLHRARLPWQNSHNEIFNSQLRDKPLNRELFAKLEKADVLGSHRIQIAKTQTSI